MSRPVARVAVGAAVVALVLLVALAFRGTFDTDGGRATDPGAQRGTNDLGGASFDPAGWETDFSRHSVPLDEFLSGGPPRDGIPPIDEPKFVPVGREDVDGREPVIALEVNGEAKAYPLQILTWHEIVNDEIGGRKVAVTFCPLCYTAIAFDREVDGRVLTFGTTGNLRFSDLVMWDRQTESWWQQFSGDAIVGELTGTTLEEVPAQLISMGEFRERFPDGLQLSRDTGHDRPYGSNPYVGYDDVDQPPFAFQGKPIDGRLSPKARVATVEGGQEFVAVPFDVLRDRPVINETVGPLPIVLWWRSGTTSALGDDSIRGSDDVGSVVVFDRRVDGRALTFEATAGAAIRDVETGTTWDAGGRATTGPLRGKRLRPVAHDAPFWFAVGAFRPDARIVDA